MVNTCIGRHGEAAIVYGFAVSATPGSEYLTTHIDKKRGPKASSVCHILKHFADTSSRLPRYRYLRCVPTEHTDSAQSTQFNARITISCSLDVRLHPLQCKMLVGETSVYNAFFDRLRQTRESRMRLAKRIPVIASVAARRLRDPYAVLDHNSYKVVAIRIDDWR